MMRFNRIPDNTRILLKGEEWVVMSCVSGMYLLQEFGGHKVKRMEVLKVEELANWCRKHRMVGASCVCWDD